MDKLLENLFPFITRKMLTFEHATTFSLRIISQASAVDTLRIRGITREGPFTFNHPTVGNSSVQSQDFRIPDIPIMVSVTDPSRTVDQGENFITLILLVNGDPLFELTSGQVYAERGISYPANNGKDTRPGGGFVVSVDSADPAAGAELQLEVPTGQIWHPISINFTLVAGAAAASRRVHLVFNLLNSGQINCFSDIDQLISESRVYSCAAFPTLPDRLDDNDILLPIPGNLFLLGGTTIDTVTTALNALDNFGVMTVLTERWFVNA